MSAPAQPPPPEARLIRLAREALSISAEAAAARMAIRFSGSRWRQIEAGRRGDSPMPVTARASTLAQMARAVGLSPNRLSEAGRDDAAAILREIASDDSKRNAEGRPPGVPRADEDDPRLKMLLAAIEAAGEGLTHRERSRLREDILAYLAANPDWQPPAPQPGNGDQQAGDTG